MRRPEVIDRTGEFLEEEAVGFVEAEAQGQVVDFLDPAELAGLAHETGIGKRVGVEVEHLLLPPEHDVVRREGVPVGPAPLRREGEPVTHSAAL